MKPLVKATELNPLTEALITETMNAYPMWSREHVIHLFEVEAASSEYWINDLYQVTKRDEGEFIHLNIRRRDGEVILRDWRHFQAIKNQLVGEEAEAVELYPAESRLVDTSNKYHLYCIPAGSRFPFGFQKRDVLEGTSTIPGIRQRSRT
jgi:hypothetical protein